MDSYVSNQGIYQRSRYVYINSLITGNPKRKWIADFPSLIKHYIRGDSWAYSDVYKMDNTFKVTVNNLVFLFILIKYSIKKNK
jgi:hypothetical protein